MVKEKERKTVQVHEKIHTETEKGREISQRTTESTNIKAMYLICRHLLVKLGSRVADLNILDLVECPNFHQTGGLRIQRQDFRSNLGSMQSLQHYCMQMHTSHVWEKHFKHMLKAIQTGTLMDIPYLAWSLKFSVEGIMRRLVLGVLECHTNRALK